MGIFSVLGRLGAGLLKGGGIGRLAKGAINIGKKVFSKVSPIVKKVFGIAKKVPSVIGNISDKRDQVANNVKDMVGMLPDSKIKNKIQDIVDRGDQMSRDVVDRGKQISDKVQPWVDAGDRMMNMPRVTMPYIKHDINNM